MGDGGVGSDPAKHDTDGVPQGEQKRYADGWTQTTDAWWAFRRPTGGDGDNRVGRAGGGGARGGGVAGKLGSERRAIRDVPPPHVLRRVESRADSDKQSEARIRQVDGSGGGKGIVRHRDGSRASVDPPVSEGGEKRQWRRLRRSKPNSGTGRRYRDVVSPVEGDGSAADPAPVLERAVQDRGATAERSIRVDDSDVEAVGASHKVGVRRAVGPVPGARHHKDGYDAADEATVLSDSPELVHSSSDRDSIEDFVVNDLPEGHPYLNESGHGAFDLTGYLLDNEAEESEDEGPQISAWRRVCGHRMDECCVCEYETSDYGQYDTTP